MAQLSDEALTPLYQQIVHDIKIKIETGIYPAMSRIPSEIELAREYQVSRITIRHAIEELCEEDILTKKQGKGTFVNPPKLERKIIRQNEVLSFSEACKREGKVAGARLVAINSIVASSAIRSFLQLKDGEEVIHIKRVRSVDETPIMIENNYVAKAGSEYLLECDLSDVSLFELLRRVGKREVSDAVETTVEITRATKEEAALLEVAVGEPLFCEKVKYLDDKGKPYVVGKQLIVGKLYIYNM